MTFEVANSHCIQAAWMEYAFDRQSMARLANRPFFLSPLQPCGQRGQDWSERQAFNLSASSADRQVALDAAGLWYWPEARPGIGALICGSQATSSGDGMRAGLSLIF